MNLAALCHSDQSFSALKNEHQRLVGELATALVEMSFEDPFSNKQAIWSVMARNRIETRPEFFEQLAVGDSIEMWSSHTDGKP
ncbi:MAG: hypothetical protein EON58_15130, partial [Alphaproteobacteria bacterium]